MIAIEVLKGKINHLKESKEDSEKVIKSLDERKEKMLKFLKEEDDEIKDLEATVFILEQMNRGDGS